MTSPSRFRPTALALLWPMALPVAIVLPMELNFLRGGVLDVHGGPGGLLLLAALWGGCALVWEIVALPFFIYGFRHRPDFRTGRNIFATLAAAAYIAVSIAFGISLMH